MRLPSKWVLGLGLLAAAPGATLAGPFDFLTSRSSDQSTTTRRSNQEIADSIAAALGAADVRGADISIEVRGGVAVVTGQIADARERQRVTQIVSSVGGVQSVDNQLTLPETAPQSLPQTGGVQQAAFQGTSGGNIQQVQDTQAAPTPAAQPDRTADSTTPRSNQAVAQQIARSIAESGLSRYDIEIRYKDGVASLVGAVSSPQQIAEAEQAARRIPHVTQVLNNLTINGAPAINYPARQFPMAGPMPQGYPAMPASQPGAMPPGAPVPAQSAGHLVHSRPNLPEHAWPAYAAYDNYAAVTYPSQYDASAWPYIGPFYPYPQVPMEWRDARLSWDDGQWKLQFGTDTDKWWWFLNPSAWQ